jgi:hypothetical protein
MFRFSREFNTFSNWIIKRIQVVPMELVQLVAWENKLRLKQQTRTCMSDTVMSNLLNKFYSYSQSTLAKWYIEFHPLYTQSCKLGTGWSTHWRKFDSFEPSMLGRPHTLHLYQLQTQLYKTGISKRCLVHTFGNSWQHKENWHKNSVLQIDHSSLKVPVSLTVHDPVHAALFKHESELPSDAPQIGEKLASTQFLPPEQKSWVTEIAVLQNTNWPGVFVKLEGSSWIKDHPNDAGDCQYENNNNNNNNNSNNNNNNNKSSSRAAH